MIPNKTKEVGETQLVFALLAATVIGLGSGAMLAANGVLNEVGAWVFLAAGVIFVVVPLKRTDKLGNDTKAVSPVIAVILMVAITVVLAATVFVLVNDIGAQTSKTPPQIGWTDSEVEDSWRVDQAPQQVGWNAFQVRADKAGVKVSLNGATYVDVNNGTYATPTSFTGTVAAGDTVTFCGAPTQVQVTLLHIESNAISHQTRFLTLQPCP